MNVRTLRMATGEENIPVIRRVPSTVARLEPALAAVGQSVIVQPATQIQQFCQHQGLFVSRV